MRKTLVVILISGFLFLPIHLLAQEGGIKVIPVGETIKPEAPAKARPKKPRATVVKAGQTFLIELATAVSSGITQVGEKVYFRAIENVGPEKNPVILSGAMGEGTVTEVDNDKKAGKVLVKLNNIESVMGQSVGVAGDVDIKGTNSQAAAGVGERFTATLVEKVVVQIKRKKAAPPAPSPQLGFAEISGKGVSANLNKGKVKGEVKLIVEPPKGVTADDIEIDSVALYKVNGKELPEAVPANAGKPKQGDANKNGVDDWTLYFDAWDFIKYQPRGSNQVSIRGKLKNGTEFDAETRVEVNY